ncbi:MAG: hypothetical protein Q8N00_05260 [Nitrospirota bacterium]|nr:hypothetical protein [Nitrospirota bacterium]MDP3598839.1 hypothetical protein [Nitrospirota bacterium]
MKQILEYLRSYGKSLLGKAGVPAVEHAMHDVSWQGRPALRVERRREVRHARISPCTYGLMRSVDRDGVILEEGYGTAVSLSPTGLRLLLGVAPSTGQLLEIQTGNSAIKNAVCLAEVCWTKPLRQESQGALYLVGCRVSFGSTHA